MDLKKVQKIFKKDLLDLVRSRGRVIALFMFPMLMIFFFGFGFGGQISGIDTCVVMEEATQDAMAVDQAMVAASENSDLFQVSSPNITLEKAKSRMEQGTYDAIVFIPQSFDLQNKQNATSQATTNVEVMVNPTESQQVRSTMLESVETIISELQGGTPPVEASQAYGDLDYMDFLAPAIIVMTIFFAAGQGTGRALAGEKEEGTLDRLAMTPTTANEIIAGKSAYAIAVQLVRAVIIVLAVTLIFGVAMNGSWLLVAVIVLLLTMASVGIGLALSALVEDESTYAEMSMMVIMPAMFVTGIFFPVSAIPSWIQPIAYVYPLTYANNAIRQVMLIGSGLEEVLPSLIILAGFAVVLYGLGMWLFNRTARG